MNYQKQYANKINWQNTPSTSTPLNATNLNKMDNALWYMDNALYILADLIGGGSDIRGGIISNISSNNFRTDIQLKTYEDFSTGELLLLRSSVSGTGHGLTVWIDEHASTGFGFVDLDGEETSITITDESIIFLMLDADEHTATVLSVINESGGIAGLGIGKMTDYSSGVITTDIDLHRDPVIGDRILLYCSSDISVSNSVSIKTYNDGVEVTTGIGPILPQTLVKGFNVLQCVASIPDGISWSVKLNVPIRTYSAGLGISIDNNGFISNTNPNYGSNYYYEEIDSAIDDGDLGNFNGYCDNLVLDFHANAVSGGNAYTLTLVTGTTTIIRKYAVLKDRSGNPFTRDIYAGMILKCKSNVSGSGTEQDPVVVMVLEISNWYVETGRKANTTIGGRSTAEGEYNTVSGAYGHADGYNNTVSGNSASAHGGSNTASGDNSVADGTYNTASGANSSAHGESTIASGVDSTASGEGTIAGYSHQTAMGRFNENKSGNLLEVGNGSDDDARSNAMEVTADGNVLDGQGNILSEVSALEQSASGNPIVVNAQGIDAKELSVALEPIQDLHGYDKPWAGGAGKNKLPMTVSGIKAENTSGSWSDNDYTLNNVTFALQTDDDDNITGIKVNGTASATTVFYVTAYGKFLSANTNYTINGCTGGGSATYKIDISVSTGPLATSYNGDGDNTPFTVANNTDYRVRIVVYSGVNLSNKLFYPMIRLSAESATFAPYTNKCPISGRTETSVTTRNEDNTDSNTATVTLGQTVYGGIVDFKAGKVTITHGILTYTGEESEPWQMSSGTGWHQFSLTPAGTTNSADSITNEFEGMAISERGNKTGFILYNDKTHRFALKDSDILITSVADWKTWLSTHNLQICYKRATPTEITVSPATLELLKGYNYITGDGEMSMVYIPESILGLPTPPTADGTYKLICTVSGGVPVFSWAAN